jgi:carboxymethylenebutenolidase
MDQRIIDLYDEYTHRPLARRVFMERLIGIVGSAVAAEAVIAAIAPDYARAAIVAENDPRVETSRFENAASGIRGYLASPKGTKPESAHAVVIVVHENRGLNPHIEDVARRVAVEGFVAMAPDLLAPLGGTPRDADRARDMFARLDLDKTADSLAALIADLKAKNPRLKVATIGFCWGGQMVNMVATRAPGLDVCVSYYGLAPKLSDVPKIKARIMEHLGALDTRVNSTIPPYEDALKKAGVKYEIFKYEGANHAFNNDTGGARYNEAAAKLAWSRTIALLKSRLAN